MTPLAAAGPGLDLLHPEMLLLALAVPLAVWVRRRRGGPALGLAPAALFDAAAGGSPLPRSWRVRILALPAVLRVLALLLVAVALAGPVRRVPLPLRTEGVDILLCLDVSSSMTARDLDGRRSRLEVARDAADRFVRGRPGDRIGLVSFARYPDVRCPPTLDHGALAGILRETAPVEGDGPEDATGIGTAVARAARALHGSGAKSRVVVLLTDGEENVARAGDSAGIAPAHAARLCRELGVRVHAVVAGGAAPGRPPVDTGPVRRLAAETGGRFFAAADAGALDAVYAEIDTLEKSRLERDRFVVEERFPPLVLAALALLLLAGLLGSRTLAVIP